MPNPQYLYTEQHVRAYLHTQTLGQRIQLHHQVGSTNDLAKQAGKRGDPEGLVILTEEQLAGRGRLGRTWTAPAGSSILCSVLLRPHFSPQHAFYLTVATALAIRQACADNLKSSPTPHPSIKWPNDVLINGRKVAGILCETELKGDGWDFAVIGFGINVNLRPNQLGDPSTGSGEALQATATSLATELGHPVDRAALLCRILEELETLYFSLQDGHFDHVYTRWASALETIGKQVSVRDGGLILAGHALRVDPDGALVLRLDGGGERRILAGDVSR